MTLVGGATARIGDPSGKDKLRPFLSEEVLEHNVKGLKKSFSKFLKFGDGATDAVMVDNWDWFKDINYLDYYDAYKEITFEDIEKRFKEHFDKNFSALSIVNPVENK